MFRPRYSIDKHSGPVYSCSFDGSTWLYSASGDRFVARWNIETGEQDAFAVQLDSAPYTVYTHSGTLYIGTANGEISAIDTSSKRLKWNKNLHGKAVFSLAFSDDHRLLFAGDEAGNLLVLDPEGRHFVSLSLNCGKIRVIQSTGNRLLAAAQDGTLHIFSLPELNELSCSKLHEQGVNTFFTDHSLIFSGGKDGMIKITDAITLSQLRSVPAHYQTVYGLVPLDAERMVSASRDKTIKVWNKEQLQVLQRLEAKHGGHRNSVNGVLVVSPDSFVTWSDDKRIVFWEEQAD